MIQPVHVAPEVLLERAGRGVSVVTGGARLSSELFVRYGNLQAARGLTAWESPDVLTWPAWLDAWWTEALLRGIVEPRPVPGVGQEHVAWSQVLAAESPPLAHLAGAVDAARDAHRLAIEWDLDPHGHATPCSEDTRAWLRWDREYEGWLERAGWQDSARVADVLADSAAEWIPCGELVLTGFDELTPQQLRVIAALQGAGCAVEWLEAEAVDGRAVRLACGDDRDEIGRAIAWARQWMDREPEARIGIVVPDLGARREMLERELDHVLVPAAVAPGDASWRRPYNVSLGGSLAETPVVRVALRLLGVNQSLLPFADAAALLASPFIDGATVEQSARARVDRELRKSGQPEVALGRLRALCRGHGCPLFAASVGALSDALRGGEGGPREPERWARDFSALLDRTGWSRGRPLDSAEYQAVDAFRDLLADLGSLGAVSGPMDRRTALGHLQRMSAARVFQPASSPARLQVLGVLESVGMRFDHLWVLGLHADAWPPAPRPNPFLPRALQAEREIPRSTPARELRVARQQTRRLLESAADVVVSHPSRAGDEVLVCAPLVAHLPVAGDGELPGAPDPGWRMLIAAAADLEESQCETAPPVHPGAVKGGSGVLSWQSNCPFHAFATYRLGAQELGVVDVGLDAMRKGSLVHRALELFWTGLDGSAELAALGEAGTAQRVAESVDVALHEFAKEYPQIVTEGFRRVERSRLCRLLAEWVALERERAPFRVLGLEQRCEVRVGDIQLNVTIDRLDALADGERVVVDYKTGRVNAADWFGERPAAPQLPLYSEALDEPVAAVAFGMVRADGVTFSGVGRADGIAPGIEASLELKACGQSWDEVRRDWRTALAALAEEFVAGDARVDPREYPKTCRYCELGGLCRVGEKLGGPVAGEDDD